MIRKGNIMICSCKADLSIKGSVTRTYISMSPEFEDAHITGYYEPSGDFETYGKLDRPLSHHDLVDGSDACTACGAILQ